MATAHLVKSARHDIWQRGKAVKKTHGKGKNTGGEYTVYDLSQPADKNDTLLVPKGSSYYWWQFQHGPKQYKQSRPKQSELTHSEFLRTVYSIQEDLEALTVDDPDMLESEVETIVSQIEELRDEQEEKRSNMPEQLQDAPTGELLQERYDNLDIWIEELQAVDLEVDMDSIREEASKDLAEGDDLEKVVKDKAQERLDEILGELQACSYQGE